MISDRTLLTDEIMYENFPDFEEGYTIGWWSNETKEDGFLVEFQDNEHEIIMKKVKYVDQLQKILDLCELNKTIKI